MLRSAARMLARGRPPVPGLLAPPAHVHLQRRGFLDQWKQKMSEKMDRRKQAQEVERFDTFMTQMLSWEGPCTLARYAAQIRGDAESMGALGWRSKVPGAKNDEDLKGLKRSLRIFAALEEQWPGAATGRLVPTSDDFTDRVAAAAAEGHEGGAITGDDVRKSVAEFTLSQFLVTWLREREENGSGLPASQPELASMLQEGGSHAMGPAVMKRVEPLFTNRGSGARMRAEHKKMSAMSGASRPASSRKARRW